MWTRRWLLRIGGLIGTTLLMPLCQDTASAASTFESTNVENALRLLLDLRRPTDYGRSWDVPRRYSKLRALWDEMSPRERDVFLHLPRALRSVVDQALTRSAEEWNVQETLEWRTWLAASVARRDAARCLVLTARAGTADAT
jgi:hypothetical protein